MIELRGAQIPSSQALTALSQSLDEFTDEIVSAACEDLARQAIGQYDAKMPSLDMILSHCRRIERERAPTVRQTRWCGLCQDGVVRSGKPKGDPDEFLYCQCRCRLCDNTGWMRVVYGTDRLYDSITDFKLDSAVRRCPNCSPQSTFAA